MTFNFIDAVAVLPALWAFLFVGGGVRFATTQELVGPQPLDRALIDEHLSRCRRCCGELEFTHELRTFLREATHEAPPDDVLVRLNQTLEELAPVMRAAPVAAATTAPLARTIRVARAARPTWAPRAKR